MSSPLRSTASEVLWAHAVSPDDHDERAARITLWSVRGFGSMTAALALALSEGRVTRFWSDPSLPLALLEASQSVVALRRGLPEVLREDPHDVVASQRDRLPAESRIIHLGDPGYPEGLAVMADPPWVLYVSGRFSEGGGRRVAIVGSRRAPTASEVASARLSRGLAEAGAQVASGGALGLDAVALRAAVDAGSKTIAVLPCGLGALSPRANLRLFGGIVASGGALISELPPTVTPRAFAYRRRNRILVGVSDAVVVARASLKSGTMIMARAALELGVPLGVMPPTYLDVDAKGSCTLLRDARVGWVLGVEDALGLCDAEARPEPTIEAVIPAITRTVRTPTPPDDVSEDALVVFGCLGREWEAQDELGRGLGWPPGRVASALTELELSGAAVKAPGASRWRAV